MHRNCFAPAFSAAVLAGALAMTGCASATTKAATAAGTSAATTPTGGAVNIMSYSINSDGPDFRAILTGAVGDYGPAVAVYPDGKVDPGHTSELELDLTHGSFRLNIADLDKRFVEAASHEPIYPSTCSDFISLTVTVPIVAGSGTGSYRGISGSFTVTVTAEEVETKPCKAPTGFLWQVIVLSGSGTVSV